MAIFATPAILLRRIDYGDFDLIVTVFSLERGKLSLIVKSGKKSRKRFAGVLELFSELEIVARRGRRGGLLLLQEANLREPFATIRSDIQKTAYASYWVELVNAWMEENISSRPLYSLLRFALAALDRGADSDHVLSVLFQVQFLKLSGHSPNLAACSICRRQLASLEQRSLNFSLPAGSIICRRCDASEAALQLSMETVKRLLWIQGGSLTKASRMRFNARSAGEALALLEAFVPYHLGRQLKSLNFLRQIKRQIDL